MKSEDMHLESVNERLDLLMAVLVFSSDCSERLTREQRLTSGERICINQERGALLGFKAYLFREMEYRDVKFYELPKTIEDKIQFINNKL